METLSPQSRRTYVAKRKQYQSCDHCRKRRRACDASSLGLDPFRRGGMGNEMNLTACTNCQKSRHSCTFNWLHTLPIHSLPPGIRRKLSSSSGTASRRRRLPSIMPSEDQSTSILNFVTPRDCNSAIPLQSHTSHDIDSQICYENMEECCHKESFPSGGFLQDTIWTGGRQPLNHLQVGTDSALFGQPIQVFANDTYEPPLSTEWNTQNSSSTGNVSVASNQHLRMVNLEQSMESSRSTITPNQITLSQENIYLNFMQSFTNSDISTLFPHSDQSGTQNFQAPLGPSYSDVNDSPTNSSISSTFATILASTDSAPISEYETLNMNEFRIAQKSSKSTIISGLMQIYIDSMEHTLACWLTQSNCPFKSTKSRLWEKSPSAPIRSSAPSLAIYKRVHQLDSAFLSLRNDLSLSGNSGASRCLKTAILAFASQWSHSTNRVLSSSDKNIISPEHQDTTLNSFFGDENADALEFEVILRHSLWDEAQRCISRWSRLDSFRVILAQIIFALVQKPPGEESLDDAQEYYRNASNNEFSSPVPPRRKLGNEKSCSMYFDTALRHLLGWRRKIENFMHQIFPANQNIDYSRLDIAQQAALQACSSFNMVFWLGIMCDTTSSVLNQRSLTIPDDDIIAIQLDYPEVTLTSELLATHNLSNIVPGVQWGEIGPDVRLQNPYQMNLTELCYNPNQNRLSHIKEYAEAILQDAVPVKVLLWRKVSNLRALVHKDAAPAELERCIGEVLRVCHHWNTTYSDFFRDCMAEHSNLPFRVQSWYILLAAHWHLACLHVTSCINQIDEQSKSDSLQRSLRRSSALVLELQNSSVFAIAQLAEMACLTSSTEVEGGHDERFHTSIRHSVLLTEPWTDVLIQVLVMTCELLCDWLRGWQCASPTTAWISNHASFQELLKRCTYCIDALKLLGRKSDIAALSANIFATQLYTLK